MYHIIDGQCLVVIRDRQQPIGHVVFQIRVPTVADWRGFFDRLFFVHASVAIVRNVSICVPLVKAEVAFVSS
jgi:predicted membrane protein